ncbi:hypothetical protein DL769_007908 [Monosporascus sp. CRB-8-3]|nr:hypothetical protein DL769_007908 [Monosporascus sp. CRB-8-3]
MLSPSGRSRMWDKDADDYTRGDGFGVLVLKTLSKALADQDVVECIIRETGINQDGQTKGITTPCPKAQSDLIRDTFSKADLNLSNLSDRPQYFEAHGTGFCGSLRGGLRSSQVVLDELWSTVSDLAERIATQFLRASLERQLGQLYKVK